MLVLVAKKKRQKLESASLRDTLHQRLRTMLLGVGSSVPNVARNVARDDASCVRAFRIIAHFSSQACGQ